MSGPASQARVDLPGTGRRFLGVAALVLLAMACSFGKSPGQADRDDPAELQPPRAAAVAQVSVNWQTQQVELRAFVPDRPGTSFKFPPTRRRAGKRPLPQVETRESTAVIRGPAPAVRALLRPETRSLSLFQDDAPIRIDLPAVDIKGIAVQPASGSVGGLILGLTAENLLPGFVLYGSAQDGDQATRFSPVPIRTSRQSSPRLLSVVSGKGNDAQLRVWIPPLPAGIEGRTWFFTLVNADSSQSRTVATVQRPTTVDPGARTIAPSRPAPVAARTRVPSVELLDVAQAFERAKKANLVPVVVDLTTLRELPAAGLEKELVLRQGLQSDSETWQGEVLLLGVVNPGVPFPPPVVPDPWVSPTQTSQPDPKPKDVDPEQSKTVPPGGETTAKGSPIEKVPGKLSGGLKGGGIQGGGLPAGGTQAGGAPGGGLINTGDDLGFVDPATLQGGLLGIDAVDPGAAGGDTNAPDTLPSGGLDGLLGGGGIDPNIDPNNSGTIPIDPDPGVLIDPVRPPDQTLLAGILRLVLDALTGKLNGNLPGGLGKAITEAIVNVEADLVAALLRGDPIDAVPADRVLDIVVRHLHVSLSDADRQRVLAAWREFARPRAHPPLLDVNRTRTVADDVVIWFVRWLFASGLYNPAQGMQVVSDPLGGLIAILVDGKISPDWISKNPPPLVLPVLPGGLTGPPGLDVRPPPVPPKTPGGGDLLIDDDVIVIPAGPALVKDSSLPDRVRVPAVKDVPMKTVVERLRDVDLKIANKGTFFTSDVVIGSRPEEKSWVKPGTEVLLTIQRRVPKVEGKPYKEAAAILQKYELKPQPSTKDVRETDLVQQQNPAEGSPIVLQGSVALVLVRPVPAVVKLDIVKGEKDLALAGFKSSRTAVAITTDSIAAQRPEPGAPAPIGSEVELDIRRPIPPVTGKTLTEARKILAGYKIPIGNDAELNIDKNRSPDTIWIIDQQPDAGRGFILKPSFKSSDKLNVDLKPGSKVPALKDIPLPRALQALKELHLVGAYKDPHEGKLPLKVTAQDVPAGKIVPYQTTVNLGVGLAGVLVPPLEGLSIPAALARLKEVGLQGTVADHPKVGGTLLVIGQKPEAHTDAKPSVVASGSTVTVQAAPLVPDVRKHTLRDAVADLKKSGLVASVAEGTVYHLDDLVLDQDPPPSVPAQPRAVPFNTRVRLTLTALVPAVKGQTLAGAKKILDEHKLGWTSDPKTKTGHANARVDEQKPAAGTAIQRGKQTVELTFKVPVPDLAGKNIEEAAKVLREHDLVPKLTTTAAKTDIVYSQTPRGGPAEYLFPGETVTLTPGVVVPQLVGLTREEADAKLRGIALLARPDGIKKEETTDPKLIGSTRVKSQNPPANQKLARTPNLSVAVALVSYEQLTIPVPPLVGKEYNAGVALLKQLGLRPTLLGAEDVRTSDPRYRNRPSEISGQKPQAGARVKPGDAVGLIVTNYTYVEPTVRVPDLTGQTLNQVAATLGGLGLKYRHVNDPGQDGNQFFAKVVRQDPAPGATVDKGSTVVIYFPPRTPAPPPGGQQGNVVGWWKVGGEIAELRSDGSLNLYKGEVNRPFVTGRWQYSNGILTLTRGLTQVQGRVEWSGPDRFSHVIGTGRLTYDRYRVTR